MIIALAATFWLALGGTSPSLTLLNLAEQVLGSCSGTGRTEVLCAREFPALSFVRQTNFVGPSPL